jgi:hypothetical protein
MVSSVEGSNFFCLSYTERLVLEQLSAMRANILFKGLYNIILTDASAGAKSILWMKK